MSGGSLDYAYSKIEDLAAAVNARAQNALHRAFAYHLAKVAKAAQELEWVLSDDSSPGDEADAIRAVVSPQEELDVARAAAEQALKDLEECLERVAGSGRMRPDGSET